MIFTTPYFFIIDFLIYFGGGGDGGVSFIPFLFKSSTWQ